MGFANQYIENNKLFRDFISVYPRKDLKYIVVIPSYNEDRITNTLDALWEAQRPRHSVEVIVLVNASQCTPESVKENNRRTISEIEIWQAVHNDSSFNVFALCVQNLSEKDFGAGLARKIGMDEAISRLDKLDRHDGYIISLDADTIVDENYFKTIEQTVKQMPGINAGIIYFEHPAEGNEFTQAVYDAVVKYELFLRYYNQALRWTGFPYAFHTIGSAFFVSAQAYVKQGGMIRRKAGEDFYFLNKIFQLGNIREVHSTTVYPSPRISGRVLFGTGPEVEKIIKYPDKSYLTYNPKAFQSLKRFFSGIDQLFQCRNTDIQNFLNMLDPGLRGFLQSIGFQREIKRINDNCKRIEVFRKHFFQWFGGLKIVRYMHLLHEEHFRKVPVHQAASEMLEILGYSKILSSLSSFDSRRLLHAYRNIERESEFGI
ncbi:MAG: glycosyltransferase [Bacteroidota bacterium]